VLSLERRYAKLVRSYDRLRDLYNDAVHQKHVLADDVRDLKVLVRSLQRESRERERASKNTMDRLFASTQYAITHLHEAGDLEAAERLSDWLDVMRENMLPVADVRRLTGLLEEWCDAMPCDDATQVASVYMRTRAALNDVTGTSSETLP
jgi:hypothetical protein